MPNKLLASSNDEHKIIKLISEYYYGSTISLVEKDNNSFYIHNLKGKIAGVLVIKKNNRFNFVEESVK